MQCYRDYGLWLLLSRLFDPLGVNSSSDMSHMSRLRSRVPHRLQKTSAYQRHERHRSVMDYLAMNGYDVYALDMRGMGESERPPDYSTIGLLDRVNDLEAVASHIKNTTGRRPMVVGFSQGGALTGVLAASRPDLVEGVGLFSVPANGFFVPPEFEELAREVIQSGVDRYLPAPEADYALTFGFDPVTGRPTISDTAFGIFYSLSEPDSVRATVEMISPEFYQATVTPSWSHIEAPALVVDGAQDLVVGEERAKALYDALVSEK